MHWVVSFGELGRIASMITMINVEAVLQWRLLRIAQHTALSRAAPARRLTCNRWSREYKMDGEVDCALTASLEQGRTRHRSLAGSPIRPPR